MAKLRCPSPESAVLTRKPLKIQTEPLPEIEFSFPKTYNELAEQDLEPKTPKTAAMEINEGGMNAILGAPFSSTNSTSAMAVVTDINAPSKSR